jgi:hypothetical protein
VGASLRYVAALAPAFAVNDGTADRGTLALEVTEPDLSIAVEISGRVAVRDGIRGETVDLVLTGDAVGLLEALSIRRPLDQLIPNESAWMVRGLAEIFESAPR